MTSPLSLSLRLRTYLHRLWDWLDSNQRPSGYEPPALTAELQSQAKSPSTSFSAPVCSRNRYNALIYTGYTQFPVPGDRIELSTRGFSVLCSTTELPRRSLVHYTRFSWTLKRRGLVSIVRCGQWRTRPAYAGRPANAGRTQQYHRRILLRAR